MSGLCPCPPSPELVEVGEGGVPYPPLPPFFYHRSLEDGGGMSSSEEEEEFYIAASSEAAAEEGGGGVVGSVDSVEVWEVTYMCLVLLFMFVSLVSDRVGADHVMMTALTLCMAAGIISVEEGLEGFANEGLVTVLVSLFLFFIYF